MKYWKVIATIIVAALQLRAAVLPNSVTFSSDGSFHIGDASFYIENFSSTWSPSLSNRWLERKSKVDREKLFLTAVMTVGGEKADVTESIKAVANSKFQLYFQARFRKPVVLNSLHGVFFLPASKRTIFLDDNAVKLPADYSKQTIVNERKVKKLRFPVAGGYEVQVVGSPLLLTIQDNRKFGENTFAFRLSATPGRGRMSKADLQLQFQISQVAVQKIDLKKIVNMGFADEVAGDGKGGWTDQEPKNDLRKIKPGTVRTGALSFDVIDPEKNNGRSVLVLAGKQRDFPTEAALLPLPPNRGRAVNLLHTSAWMPDVGATIGTIIAEYEDGTSVRIPVISGSDCGNWQNPTEGKNALIAWSVEKSEVRAGLYVSSFTLPKSGPKLLRFEVATPDSVWMIAAVTLSERPVSFHIADNKPVEIHEDSEWKPIAFKRKIFRGSALDFSFLADAPAGKYGFIRPTPQGQLTFEKEPKKHIRLYGVNLCFTANYLTKESVDQLADYFLYCGYNAVRLHHHDTLLLDSKAKDSLTLNAAQLDKLDYLLFRMKEKGIYVTTDLFTNRVFRPEDEIPECDFYNQWQMKALLPVSLAAMENWKEFAKRWMTHRNPYTGLTWAEDPALFCVNLVNEEVLAVNWNCSPSCVKLYESAFAKYCAEKKIEKNVASNNNPIFLRFLYELQDKVLEEQIRFVKETLGMKAMITSLNHQNYIPLTLLRQRFDLVDNHAYFDHPVFPEIPWRAPFRYRQTSALRLLAEVPRKMMATRLPGKPFIVTEFNYCNPNIFRAEGGPLIGGYAALQNWDALFRFAWSHTAGSISKIGGAYGFDAVNDPMAQLSDRIAIAMFRRADVSPAKKIYAYTVSPACFDRGETDVFPENFQNLGLVTGIGSVPLGDRNIPEGTETLSSATANYPSALKDALIAKLWQNANKRSLAVSATGELRLDGHAGNFTVSTPRTESITLISGSLAAKTLRVKEASCFQTVAAISLDGKPLPESESVLVIHLTNVANSGALFSTQSQQILKKTGSLPLLIKKGRATVELVSSRPWQVTALNCDGAPYGPVKGSYQQGVFRFTAETTLFPGGVMAYHLTR